MKSNKPKTQALSLLEGILEETQNEAAAERARLEEELRRKEEETRRAREAEERQRRDDAERRVAEEEERRRQAAARRAEELERLRIEELKAKGLWKEPEPEEAPAPPVANDNRASARPTMTTQEALTIARSQSRKQTLTLVAILFLIVAAAGGGGAAWYMISTKEYVDASTVYAKSQPNTVALARAVATIGFDQVPDPPVPVPTVEEEAAAAAAAGARRAPPRTTRPAGGAAAETSTGGPPRLQLGGNVGRRD